MQEAMKNAKYVNVPRILSYISLHFIRAGSTHRAWQELPRHLRRRAASHNVRRVPLRLRSKSRAEVSDTYLYIYSTHTFSDGLSTPKNPGTVAPETWKEQTRTS